MIKHVLHDGRMIDSIEGKMISAQAFKTFYKIVEKIVNEGRETKSNGQNESVQNP